MCACPMGVLMDAHEGGFAEGKRVGKESGRARACIARMHTPTHILCIARPCSINQLREPQERGNIALFLSWRRVPRQGGVLHRNVDPQRSWHHEGWPDLFVKGLTPQLDPIWNREPLGKPGCEAVLRSRAAKPCCEAVHQRRAAKPCQCTNAVLLSCAKSLLLGECFLSTNCVFRILSCVFLVTCWISFLPCLDLNLGCARRGGCAYCLK